ncbi:MAG: thiamine ABC transporter substrate-binding protein [Bdellovibrionales bacterium]|nr:thiamine ABC transporter substrate-binding protein [Bdellovibrionales bacterium]
MRIKSIIILTLLAAVIFAFGLWKFKKDSQGMRESAPIERNLTVFTYPSFMSDYGPGPKLKEEFEKNCHCRVRYLNAGDSVIMLQKLKIKSKLAADVVIGLDQFTQNMAASELEWLPLEMASDVKWREELRGIAKDVFIPYDWAPITFIYRKGELPELQSLEDLKNAKYISQLSLQDPRSSTPGLQFLYWLYAVYGSEGMFTYLKEIQPSIQSISPSWSASYGLFKQKQAGLTLSYLTSPLYHWREEGDRSYQAAAIKEGHPVQVEFMAVPKRCKECDLAKEFVRYLLEPPSQKIIADHNFMLPVIENVESDPLWKDLPELEILPANRWEEFLTMQDQLLQNWVQVSRGQ